MLVRKNRDIWAFILSRNLAWAKCSPYLYYNTYLVYSVINDLSMVNHEQAIMVTLRGQKETSNPYVVLLSWPVVDELFWTFADNGKKSVGLKQAQSCHYVKLFNWNFLRTKGFRGRKFYDTFSCKSYSTCWVLLCKNNIQFTWMCPVMNWFYERTSFIFHCLGIMF